jgi:hypothetical protein
LPGSSPTGKAPRTGARRRACGLDIEDHLAILEAFRDRLDA